MAERTDEGISIENAKSILTDENAWKIHVLSTLRDMSTGAEYRRKMAEKQEGEIEKIQESLGEILHEHGTCFNNVKDLMAYRSTFEWGKEVHSTWGTIKMKLIISGILAGAAFLMYLYVLHGGFLK